RGLILEIQWLNQQNLLPLMCVLLLSGDDVTHHASDDHNSLSIVSTMATTDASVGTSCGLNANAASRPRHTYTVSPAPAPTASTATTEGPFGSRRMSNNFLPSSDASLTVETTRPMTRPKYIVSPVQPDR